jgi:trans-2-enoyl-CoA reductase
MDEQWTRDELVALYPEGSVNVQIDDDVRPMTSDEWSGWIDAQVGTEKILEEPPA